MLENTQIFADTKFSQMGKQNKTDLCIETATNPLKKSIRGRTDRLGDGQVDENDLIRSARAGDLAAFNRLVIAHQDRLYWWIFSMVKDEDLADDLAQSTFITAYEKLHTFRSGSFRSWLFSIARNRSIDEFRRKKRHPSISLDAFQEEEKDFDLLSVIPDETQTPEEIAVQSEQAELVNRLLQGLPEIYRQLLQLVDMDGWDYQEAADLLNIPLGTMKSRLVRARLKFRELYMRQVAGSRE
jgi:RNA polymerase sigma-70 factor (ECF subfamily)